VRQAMRLSSALLICIGAPGNHDWQQAELRTISGLERKENERLLVVPVLLPSAEPAQTARLWGDIDQLDFRTGKLSERELIRLVNAIESWQHRSLEERPEAFGVAADESVHLQETRLGASISLVGVEHPDTLTSLSNLAQAKYAARQFSWRAEVAGGRPRSESSTVGRGAS